MITKTLDTTSGKIKVSIPGNLNEITLGQVIELHNNPELYDIKAISILSGIPLETLQNTLDYSQFSIFTEYVKSLAHQIKYCYDGATLPKTVSFGTKPVKRFGFVFQKENKVEVITNLSMAPAGAFMASRDIIATEINRHIEIYGEDKWREHFNPNLESMALVLAHYFYCRVTGDMWSEQKAEAFKSEVLKLSLQTALPIARHFFLNYPDLSKQKISLWAALRQRWKYEQALRRLKNSASTTR